RSFSLSPQSSRDAGVTALGVIRQRALDGWRASFDAPGVVGADDRFGGGLGVSPAIALATRRTREPCWAAFRRTIAFA
ncbi:MAG: hypothetical protein ACXVH3_35970, partial [Solirubrobacteraceae bacterium]